MRLTFLMPAYGLTGDIFALGLLDMADALLRLLNEPASAWRARSQQAHMRAHAYSWDDATQRFLKLLNFYSNFVAKEGQDHE